MPNIDRALRAAGPGRSAWTAVVLCLLCSLLISAGGSAASGRPVAVIVTASSAAEAGRAVTAAGGRITRSLDIVDGVAAVLDAARVGEVAGRPGVRAVTPDAPVRVHGAWRDPGIPARVQKVVRSDRLWRRGITGQGVTVAVLDTGVYAASPDLQGPAGSRVIHCEDFTHERATEANCADTFGHGTFMAGLIAGDGTASHGRYMGAAPQADLVSIKVAGYDGSTDVSTVLAGLQWAVAFRSVYGIRVLNLSLGSDSSQDYRLSPLDFAVERAWGAGIVVVVSAGNSGPDAATVSKPGDDPYVITVGAADDMGTVRVGDDAVPVFSARGPTRSNGFAKPDVIAPGVHTVGLRSPGSAIDQAYGSTAAIGEAYFRGTGTSMSTATVSGVVAQMLQREPWLDPDQVKQRLLATARPVTVTDPYAAGAGEIDALSASTAGTSDPANQGIDPSTGLGLLQQDRGSLVVQVVTPAGQVDLHGEFVAQTDPGAITDTSPGDLVAFSAAVYASRGWDPTSWGLTWWATSEWAGMAWRGTDWRATTWNGTGWDGMTWKDDDWDGMTWKDQDWEGMTWKATAWQSVWYAAAWS